MPPNTHSFSKVHVPYEKQQYTKRKKKSLYYYLPLIPSLPVPTPKLRSTLHCALFREAKGRGLRQPSVILTRTRELSRNHSYNVTERDWTSTTFGISLFHQRLRMYPPAPEYNRSKRNRSGLISMEQIAPPPTYPSPPPPPHTHTDTHIPATPVVFIF